MKTKITLSFWALIIFALINLGNSSGRASAFNSGGTSAPGEGTACGSCHTGGNFGTAVSITLTDMNTGAVVTEYVPNTTYNVQILINTTNNPGGYGFQALALKTIDNTSVSTWANNGTGGATVATVNATQRQYFEHNQVLSSNEMKAFWTAPDAGSGDVRIYAVGNAVNNNGSTSGDQVNNATITLTELTTSTEDIKNLDFSFQYFPNPVMDNLTLDISSTRTKDLTINILASNGQRLSSQNTTVNTGNERLNISTMDFPKGIYFLEITDGQERTVKRFLKF